MRFLFGDYALDLERRELRRGAELVEVEPQGFDLLAYLVEHRDRVASKDDLLASVWRGRIVSESTLTSRITAARRAIGDSGEQQALIKTYSRKGFRFIGDVQRNGARPGERRDETDTASIATEADSAGAALKWGGRPVVAVLPFKNMSDDADQEYFSDGITEDII